MNELDVEKSHLKSIVDTIEEKFSQLDRCRKQNVPPQRDLKPEENECRDVHISNAADPTLVAEVCLLQTYAIHYLCFVLCV